MATSVFTQFNFKVSECPTDNQINIDTCSPFCGSGNYVTINYDARNEIYKLNLYSDDNCQFPNQEASPFSCTDSSIGTIDVSCADSVDLYDYKSFEILGSGVKCPVGNSIPLALNECGYICDNYAKIITNGNNVNGITLGLFSDEECIQDPKVFNVMCKPDNATISLSDSDMNVVCYSTSSNTDSNTNSSSTVAYSLVLLVSAALLNILL